MVLDQMHCAKLPNYLMKMNELSDGLGFILDRSLRI